MTRHGYVQSTNQQYQCIADSVMQQTNTSVGMLMIKQRWRQIQSHILVLPVLLTSSELFLIQSNSTVDCDMSQEQELLLAINIILQYTNA
jgi:hypothetical protein